MNQNPVCTTKLTDVITFDVTTDKVKELYENRAKTHEKAAGEWKKRSEDEIWCQRTSIANEKELKRRAAQQGTMTDKVPDAAGIAEFAAKKGQENIEAAGYARQLGAAVTPNTVFQLSQMDYLDLIGDITPKISPIDPVVEKDPKAS